MLRIARRLFTTHIAAGLCALLSLASIAALAATTDIANQPLITLSKVTAKPNLMFILDNSGSMGWDYMPDDMGDGNGNALSGTYGYRSAQCNGVAYDPTFTYAPPVDSTGASYANSSLSAAWDDGYTKASTVNLGPVATNINSLVNLSIGTGPKTFTMLGGNFNANTFTVGDMVTITPNGATSPSMRGTITAWSSSLLGLTWTLQVNVASTSGVSVGAFNSWTVTTDGAYYYRYTGSQPAMGWTYDSARGAVVTTTAFYGECTSAEGSSPGSGVFTRVVVGSAEATNYANWYSYYRKRYLLMRTSVGKAFTALDANYRVGFSTISDTGAADGSNFFRNVRPFDATQKSNFYSSLYGVSPGGSTPLRSALTKAGRYFARQVPGQSYDPMEYSCQRNFALLSTDGYWNGTYGYQLDGTTKVGNQDGAEARPMKDDSNAADTLADVAQYYYSTDLRTSSLGNCTSTTSGTSTDVCANNVPTSGRDTATTQHMTTYTIGLGVNGTLAYDKNYLTQSSGDYVGLTNGSKSWPAPGNTQSTAGNGGDARNIDDLWHAAVNGRGQYYSALNAGDLAEAISGVVTSVKETTGSGSAAGANALNLVSGGTNVVYQASYTTVTWTGELAAYTINDATGDIATTPTWSAQALLDSKASTTRNIYFNSNGALANFTYTNLSATQQAYFSNLCAQSTVAAQCNSLSTANKTLANNGVNLVNYLRGVRTYEASNSASPLFRTRAHVLGDIINSTPVYVGAPPFNYADAGYAAFKAAKASRTPVVYTGANDGMLHAFSAATGQELWAYVPTAVMPQMYKLADAAYATTGHQYYVDGEAVEADIYANGAWKTILVGGLNSGGRGYYALDITTPESPALLWEFSTANLGLTYGNPIVTKQADGTWVVAFTSGYNNTSPGDGTGHLYVLNANTGALLRDISTGVGTTATPSGLARINVWVNSTSDNTGQRFYGGDLLGNLWRFDTDNQVQPYLSALRLAQFQSAAGAQQPITVQPLLKLVSSSYPVVTVATGRYLGTSDITDTTVQSVAAVKDPLTTTGWGVVRSNANFVRQTYTVSGTTVTGTKNTVDWNSKGGWWLDLPNSGERVVTGMAIQGDTLIAASTIPSGDTCTSGGASWLYQVSLLDGTATDNVGQLLSPTSIVVGFTTLTLSTGKTMVYVKDSTGAVTRYSYTGASGTGIGPPHRTSWRELID